MRAPPLMLSGVTRRNRHETIAGVGALISGTGGWIVDHALFSNLAATIRAEIPRAGLGQVGEKLGDLGIALDGDSAEALAVAAEKQVDEEVVLSLNLTFLHDEPDLKHPVPAIPG